MEDYLSRVIFASLKLPNNVILRDLQIDEDGRYWITSDCRVLSICDEQPLYRKFHDNGDGYLQLEIGRRKYYLHRLMALTFNADAKKEAIKNSLVVHHLDRDKSNNSLTNLCLLDDRKHRAIHSIWKKIDTLEIV